MRAKMTTVRIKLLGPLEVEIEDSAVAITGRQARIILSLLAINAGTAVTTDSIVATLWPEDTPKQARKTVQVYIANLRTALGGEASPILSVPNGYSLAKDTVTVDIHEFDNLVAASGNGNVEREEAIDLLRQAAALWHGDPFVDLDVESLRGESSRLEEARAAAVERRIGLELDGGRHAELLGELEALTREHPFREGLRAQQMLALYRSGRQADALRVFTRTRDFLGEELGIEPSLELKKLENHILNQSPDLDLIAPTASSAEAITFLVTELVGSAEMWEANPTAMTEAVARHDEILESAITSAGGRIFKGTGDGVLAAMPNVDAAVSVAIAAQRQLTAEPWVDGDMSVRMAIDHGVVDERNGDYFGPPLNRACRGDGVGAGRTDPHDRAGHVDCTLNRGSRTRSSRLHRHRTGCRPPARSVHARVRPRATEHRPSGACTPPAGFDHSLRGYELRERLGEGTFGAVYRAYQPAIGREVAIKVIRPEYANRPSFIRRFEVEAQLVAQIEHPHVVTLYDYWRDPDGAYLVMRLLQGGSLREALDGRAFTPPAALRLLDQVGSALAAAHRQGVVHRDIKPENVLLDTEGSAYLSDFGIAARTVDSTGAPLSVSPAYVSPEEIAGRTSSPSSDIYSLGMLAFELLTATQPEIAAPRPRLSQMKPELPPAIDAVIDQATAADPAARFTRIEDLLRAMRQALGIDVVTADLPSEPDGDVRNPYLGLRAFQERDAADFFGRDAIIDELVELVEERPLVAVVGPSGSGKSSVVRAGLLARLRQTGSDRPWFITEMFPGSYPFEELEGALSRIASQPIEGLSDDLRSDELGLVRAVKRLLPDDDSRLLLVIDQFEELFSLTTDETVRDHFVASLVAAADDARGRLTVVVTVRADFFDRPLAYGEFGELLRQGLSAVAMPSRESLALAVSRPARAVGLELEAGLVQEVVHDVADEPGGLPLMQHALSELFHQRRGRTLTIEGYHESGGVLGALSRRADEIYLGLGESAQAAARQVFLRLVRADESSNDTRRRVRRSELEALGLDRPALDEVIQEFGSFRLLSFDRDPVTRGPDC